MDIDFQKVEDGVRMILEGVGENPERAGLLRTPARVAKMYAEVLSGHDQCPDQIIKVLSDESYDELVMVKDIPFYSLCEHHLLPFHGKAHVAYIPENKSGF